MKKNRSKLISSAAFLEIVHDSLPYDAMENAVARTNRCIEKCFATVHVSKLDHFICGWWSGPCSSSAVGVSVRDLLPATIRVSVRDLLPATIRVSVRDLLPATIRVSVRDLHLASVGVSVSDLCKPCYLCHSWHPKQVLPPWVREDLGAMAPKG